MRATVAAEREDPTPVTAPSLPPRRHPLMRFAHQPVD